MINSKEEYYNEPDTSTLPVIDLGGEGRKAKYLLWDTGPAGEPSYWVDPASMWMRTMEHHDNAYAFGCLNPVAVVLWGGDAWADDGNLAAAIRRKVRDLAVPVYEKEHMLTTAQAAERIGVGETRVSQFVTAGRLHIAARRKGPNGNWMNLFAPWEVERFARKARPHGVPIGKVD